MVDYTSLSIEQPIGNRFREECPAGLNQSEFLAELLDHYKDHATPTEPQDVGTVEELQALRKRIDDMETDLKRSIPRETAEHLR